MKEIESKLVIANGSIALHLGPLVIHIEVDAEGDNVVIFDNRLEDRCIWSGSNIRKAIEKCIDTISQKDRLT